MNDARVTLVLGGTRSGKSAYAEACALSGGAAPVYIATAQAFDGEMEDRIVAHRERRGAEWRTVEEPLDLTGALRSAENADSVILVDCLTLWLNNLMAAERDIGFETAALIETLSALRGRIVLVASEVGLGIVPENALARAFRDCQGQLNQAVAAAADRVVFVAAGLPLVLKGAPE